MDRNSMHAFASKMRLQFPMYQNNKDLIYLDSGATSLKPKCVLDKMNEYYENYGVNIHRGVYHLSYLATAAYDDARECVAKFIGADTREIIFSKNVTEALNSLCLMYTDKLEEDDEVITTYLEHHSSILPWMMQAKKKKIKVSFISLDNEGRVRAEEFKKIITKKSKVLAITLASNVMGYITDISQMIKIAHENNMIVIVDAAQAVGHMTIDVKKMDCDFLAFSGHKMFGPTGIGVLYGKYALLKTLDPLFYGGDMNEDVSINNVDIKEVPYCFEAGTPPIAEAIGLSEAIKFIKQIGMDKIIEHDKALIEYIKSKMKDTDGVTFYNKNMDTPIIAFNIDNVHPHDAASFFDEAHICLRAGHHCAQLLTKWLGCTGGTLRASMYVYNDYEDVDRLFQTIDYIVKFFKELGVK